VFRERVDGLGADQVVDIKDAAIVWVLRAGAGPEAALGMRAGLFEALPACPGSDIEVLLVSQLRVGDAELAAQGQDLCLALGAGSSLSQRSQPIVGHRVDAADEEACYGGDTVDGQATVQAFF